MALPTGSARNIRHAGDPHAAEIAVTVVDDWQGCGLAPNWRPGCLAVPATKGICRCRITVLACNRDSLTFAYGGARVPGSRG